MPANRSDRSYIIWMSCDGSGKARKINVGKKYIYTLMTIIFICVLSIPALQMRLNEARKQLNDLKAAKTNLTAEVRNLEYIKNNLAEIEANEMALREYFGMEKYASLNMLTGTGGTPDMIEYESNPNDQQIENSGYSLPLKLKNLNSNLSVLKQLVSKQENILRFTPNMMPVEKENAGVSSGFGWRSNPFTQRREFHAGIDIAGKTGMKIIAPADGVVLRTGYDQRLGKFVVMQHTEEMKTIYGHLNSISAEEGNMIERGEILGSMGNTGLSTSSHLHYAVTVNDRCVNPLEYILDRRNR